MLLPEGDAAYSQMGSLGIGFSGSFWKENCWEALRLLSASGPMNLTAPEKDTDPDLPWAGTFLLRGNQPDCLLFWDFYCLTLN